MSTLSACCGAGAGGGVGNGDGGGSKPLVVCCLGCGSGDARLEVMKQSRVSFLNVHAMQPQWASEHARQQAVASATVAGVVVPLWYATFSVIV